MGLCSESLILCNLPHCTIWHCRCYSSEKWIRTFSLAAVPGPLVTSYLKPLSCLYGRALSSWRRTDWCWKCTGTLPHTNAQRTIYALASHLHWGLYWENWRLLVSVFHRSDRGRACDKLHNGACMGISLIAFGLVLEHSSTFPTEWICFLSTDALLCFAVMSSRTSVASPQLLMLYRLACLF